MRHVLVDGRVFSTSAFDRGMGRYVMHLIDLLEASGHCVTILLFRNCYLPPDHPLLTGRAIRFANHDAEEYIADSAERARKTHEFTAYLSALIEDDGFDVYVDSTPFIGPLRFDIFGCAVLAVCYDFIPLKYPDFYLSVEPAWRVYYNGLARLAKADYVLCISETTRAEAARYLAIQTSRLGVVAPPLEERYRRPLPAEHDSPHKNPYLFAILGHHKSKNPEGSVRVYQQLLQLKRFKIRLNAPKLDQMEFLRANLQIPKGIRITNSIAEEEKHALQSQAHLIAHLSLEEGFGIPLLEGLFLGRKIIALDIAINREVFDKAPSGLDSAVFLLGRHVGQIDEEAFARFLDTPSDPNFFCAIRDAYLQHWHLSPSILSNALECALSNYKAWGEKLQAKIFSSIPGSYCGVADYSIAYTRSAHGNVMFFFSEGEQENISYLPNVRLGTYLDFERFSRSRFAHVPGLFNFAFSPALHPGIDFLRTTSKAGDVVLIHERRYFDGLRAMQWANGRVDEMLLDFAKPERPPEKTRLARDFAFNPLFNSRNVHRSAEAPIRSAWLRSLPVRAISHLSAPVMEQMRLQAQREPGSVINDLESLEQDFQFVPLGIDDRRHPSLIRAARRLRILRQIQQDDIVVGHFGLILDDVKRLWDVATAFLSCAATWEETVRDGRRAFFFLVGKIIDAALFNRIKLAFFEAGLGDRLVHTNPKQEVHFDTEIVACDAIACFRVQTRGQLSHVFVRALSLGTPVLVNERSGYAYDPLTTIADDNVPGGFAAAIERLSDPSQLTEMRRRARREFERTHRGDASLRAILRSEAK